MPGRAVGASRSRAGWLAAGAGGPRRAAAADRAAARRGQDPGDRPARLVADLRGGVVASARGWRRARRGRGGRAAPADRGVAGRTVPGGSVPAGGWPTGGRGGLLRRRRPAGQRVHGVGVPVPDLPPAAGVPDPDRGAGAHVRAAVRGSARGGRVGGDPGGSGRVERAAGAAGPARGSGTATTICSATCCWPSWGAGSPP